jgi:hypothetical protein
LPASWSRAKRIFRLRIILDDLGHRLDRPVRHALILRHVGDLLRIGKTDQILHIGRIFGIRILRHIAVAGGDRFIVAAKAILAEGAHHERLAAPFRERVLLVDRVELARGFGNVTGLHIGQALIVECFRRIGLHPELGDVDILVRLASRYAKAGADQYERNKDSPCRFTHSNRPYMVHSTFPARPALESPP